MKAYPRTPDGRYFVAAGRLWRCSNPALPEEERKDLVTELASARSAIRHAKNNPSKLAAERRRVHAAKVALGERGPVWWTHGAPDYLRKAPHNSPYADWWASLSDEEKQRGL